MTARRLLLATGNAGKVREVRAMLADTALDIVGLAAFPGVPEAVEDRDTFAGNAEAKARHYAKHTGLPALADDSGLEVDALEGAPGVLSARYAGEEASDGDNNALLISRLSSFDPERRTARFRCAMALVDGDVLVAAVERSWEGVIVTSPRGTNGFGYDPYFYIPAEGCTSAELPPERKNQLSHRGQALRAMQPALRHHFGG